MSIFTLIAGIGPDDWDEYETGAIDQRDRCDNEARILAFGAIRRAAEVARHHDRISIAAFARNDELVCERHEENADAIRDAISAAIRSEKA